MNNQLPSHLAYVVTESNAGGKRRSHWHRVGAVWSHKDGVGFDVVLAEGIAVNGRIVCTVPRDRDEAVAD